MRTRVRRGQAIVEATLGIIVFVTVLLFGIHFTEITVTQMKVTEAAQAAIWDSTSGEMHTLPVLLPFTQNFAKVNTRVALATASANARYQDFDGRTAINGPAPQQILSSARDMVVQCSMGAGLPQKGAGGILTFHEMLVYTDNNGMRCQADAWVDPFGTMKIGAFLEDANGFFGKDTRSKHQAGSPTQTAGYHTCAVNKANGLNGPCRGEFGMLIDDWGMASGGQEEGICPVLPWGLPCPTNINYWTSPMVMYQLNSLLFQTQSGDDYNLVKTVVGTPPAWTWPNIPFLPGNPTSFYMSFYGEQTLFMGFTPWAGDMSSWFWQTTPFTIYFPSYTVAYFASSGCYLGKPCNSSSITNP